MEAQFRMLPLSLNDTREYARELLDDIRELKVSAGLIDAGNEQFRKFFLNWKRSRCEAYTLDDKHSVLRWIIRKLREIPEPVT